VFVPHSKLQAKLIKTPGCYYLTYYLWHRIAFGVAQQLHEIHQFDFAHQANMTGYREPGLLSRLPIPLIWGPVGGAQNFPWRFLSILSWGDAAVESARNVINWVQLKTSFRVRRAARKAAQIIAANSTNQRALERLCGVPVSKMIDVGISELGDYTSHEPPKRDRIRILWSGLIEARKALILLVEAVAQLPADVDWEVQVLGDGPLLCSCRRRTRELGIDQRFTWLGWRDRSEALAHFAWADVLAFTSLRDTTGTVVLEALSHGVPVVCLDHQGVGDIINSECGVKIPVTSAREVIAGLAIAFRELAKNPAQLLRLKKNARRRASLYTWSRLGEQMAECYQQVLRDADAEVCERVADATDHPVDEKLFV
jgi:glycosyltransferase involved in cell wall biosynthesis